MIDILHLIILTTSSLTIEVEAVTHALRWIASRGGCQPTHAISCRRLLQKVKSEMESPDWNVSVVDIHLPKFLRMYCPRHAGVKGNVRADRLAGQATIGSGLRLGRLEALRNLRHYLRAQSQGHNTIYRLQERSVERGSARRSFLKGREGTIVDETSIGTISKVSLGKPVRNGVERIWAFPSA